MYLLLQPVSDYFSFLLSFFQPGSNGIPFACRILGAGRHADVVIAPKLLYDKWILKRRNYDIELKYECSFKPVDGIGGTLQITRASDRGLSG
jgi:hypothetical protein